MSFLKKIIGLPLIKAIFNSKKLGVAITASLVMLLTQLGLPENVAVWIVGALMSYIGSQGLVDFALVLKGLKTV